MEKNQNNEGVSSNSSHIPGGIITQEKDNENFSYLNAKKCKLNKQQSHCLSKYFSA